MPANPNHYELTLYYKFSQYRTYDLRVDLKKSFNLSLLRVTFRGERLYYAYLDFNLKRFHLSFGKRKKPISRNGLTPVYNLLFPIRPKIVLKVTNLLTPYTKEQALIYSKISTLRFALASSNSSYFGRLEFFLPNLIEEGRSNKPKGKDFFSLGLSYGAKGRDWVRGLDLSLRRSNKFFSFEYLESKSLKGWYAQVGAYKGGFEVGLRYEEGVGTSLLISKYFLKERVRFSLLLLNKKLKGFVEGKF